jgi:hypothetical protein
MAVNIVVDQEEDKEIPVLNSKDPKLVSWVMGYVLPWADYRDSNYKDKWEEYNRIYRGIWSAEDKTRTSERSRLISPSTAQAIEVSVAEIEEAVFGSGRWFDVEDDAADQDTTDMDLFRNQLLEDLEKAQVPRAMSEVFLNAALYGTGIGEIVMGERTTRTVVPLNNFGIQEMQAELGTEVVVGLEPVQPDEFVIDPAARSIEESLGVATEKMKPRHIMTAKQESGEYRKGKLGSYSNALDLVSDEDLTGFTGDTDEVKVTTWHGLVPSALIDPELEDDEEFEDLGIDADYIDEYDLVEAIVTIANDSTLLKAVINPYEMQDRSIIAFQYDTIPNQFWGRGVTEKAYNSQKALDAELRGRMDAMALAIHPMMAMDSTRVPRGGDLSVRPGRTILTNGDPRTVLMPFNFGSVGTNTFAQSGDLERMVQMATGSMDSSTPVGQSPRNATSGGMSMIMGGSIKRSKRTLANIEDNFTSQLIEKAAWRYMQFAPERYPVNDYKFVVHSTLGIMAREVEQQQLTQLLQTVPSGSPAFWMLITNIYENSSISNKEDMLVLVKQMLEQSMQPQPDPMVELKKIEIQKNEQFNMAKLQIEGSRAQTEAKRVELEAAKTPATIQKIVQDTILAMEKAKGEQVDRNLEIREQDRKEREMNLEAEEKGNQF